MGYVAGLWHVRERVLMKLPACLADDVTTIIFYGVCTCISLPLSFREMLDASPPSPSPPPVGQRAFARSVHVQRLPARVPINNQRTFWKSQPDTTSCCGPPPPPNTLFQPLASNLLSQWKSGEGNNRLPLFWVLYKLRVLLLLLSCMTLSRCLSSRWGLSST